MINYHKIRLQRNYEELKHKFDGKSANCKEKYLSQIIKDIDITFKHEANKLENDLEPQNIKQKVLSKLELENTAGVRNGLEDESVDVLAKHLINIGSSEVKQKMQKAYRTAQNYGLEREQMSDGLRTLLEDAGGDDLYQNPDEVTWA